MIRTRIAAALVALSACCFSSKTEAAFLTGGFDIDLSVLGLGLTGTLTDIGEIKFTGLAHTELVVDNGTPGVVDMGDISVIQGLLTVTSLQKALGGFGNTSTTGEILNANFEITMAFSVVSQSTSPAGPIQTFTHIVDPTYASGLLNIYVDTAVNSNTAPLTGGAGFQDGTLLATFRILPGGGGIFTTATLDGSDDATFELIYAVPGALIDSVTGEDLGALLAGGDPTDPVLITMTDSNFDATPGVPFGFVPANWPGSIAGDTALTSVSNTSFFATEDGSSVLAVSQVPEPASMILFATGLVAFPGLRRRMNRNKQQVA
ncbi:MAG: PEP-CTERM sorting domain-containing protein [Planctomycetaceae bacterium]|nr:PEP-CTERM sorting domain-containing protein [Planctomycetaceae bacterium]